MPLEVDSTGLLKLNPLFLWDFKMVQAYIEENNVPQNALLAKGYRSVGDWHSTVPSAEGDSGERAGRWKGRDKTECGLHKDHFKLKRQVQKKQVSRLPAAFTVIARAEPLATAERGGMETERCRPSRG